MLTKAADDVGVDRGLPLGLTPAPGPGGPRPWAASGRLIQRAVDRFYNLSSLGVSKCI